MSWVTIIWSMVASACLTMAVIHLLVWSRDRNSWAHLCFSLMVVGVLGLAMGELLTMKVFCVFSVGQAALIVSGVLRIPFLVKRYVLPRVFQRGEVSTNPRGWLNGRPFGF